MKRAIVLLLAGLIAASCASRDLQTRCKRPAFIQQTDDCGPLQQFP